MCFISSSRCHLFSLLRFSYCNWLFSVFVFHCIYSVHFFIVTSCFNAKRKSRFTVCTIYTAFFFTAHSIAWIKIHIVCFTNGLWISWILSENVYTPRSKHKWNCVLSAQRVHTDYTLHTTHTHMNGRKLNRRSIWFIWLLFVLYAFIIQFISCVCVCVCSKSPWWHSFFCALPIPCISYTFRP